MKEALSAAAGLLLGVAAAWWALRRRWQAPFAEVERLLERWSQGELGEPVDASRLGAAKGLAASLERTRVEQWRMLNEGQRDVTLERLRLDAAIRQLDDGVVLCNLRGDVIKVNTAAARLLGLPSDDMSASEALEARAMVQQVLKSRTQGELVEVRRSDATPASAFVTVSVLLPANSEPCVLLVLRDASSRQLLEKSNDEFFRAISEQLRAPVSAVQGYARLLETSLTAESDKKLRGYAGSLSQVCEELAAALQDALDSARIDAGQLALSALPSEPGALLRRAAKPFEPRAEQKGVRLELSIAADSPPSVDLDERLMGRALHRLLAEALSAARRGETVELGVSAAGRALAQVWVAVHSSPEATSGAAAAFDAAARIVRPARDPMRDVELCRKVARLHGGELEAQPARWTLRLPLRQLSGDPAQPAAG